MLKDLIWNLAVNAFIFQLNCIFFSDLGAVGWKQLISVVWNIITGLCEILSLKELEKESLFGLWVLPFIWRKNDYLLWICYRKNKSSTSLCSLCNSIRRSLLSHSCTCGGWDTESAFHSLKNIETNECSLSVAENISFNFVLPKAPFSDEDFQTFFPYCWPSVGYFKWNAGSLGFSLSMVLW